MTEKLLDNAKSSGIYFDSEGVINSLSFLDLQREQLRTSRFHKVQGETLSDFCRTG